MSDEKLSREEIAALLAGTEDAVQNKQNHRIHSAQIVLTIYGKNKCVTHTSVHLFDEAGPAYDYCNKINNLTFAGY